MLASDVRFLPPPGRRARNIGLRKRTSTNTPRQYGLEAHITDVHERMENVFQWYYRLL
jgi:hypothetical protein